jgi:hypothetical protein
MNKDLNLVIDKSSIQISDTKECLLIRSRFKLLDKSNIGTVLFLIMGLFIMLILIIIGIIRENWIPIMLGSTIGGATFMFSVLAILKQATDFVKVTNDSIKYMNSLTTRLFHLNSEMKVKMKAETEHMRLKSQPGSGSYFRTIELYLVHDNSEYRMFNFQVDGQYSKEANKLGSELTRLIKTRINDSI